MKLNDFLAGALLALLAGAVLLAVRGYPTIPGQDVGPAAFPTAIAVLLLGCALALMVRGWRGRRAGPWLARAEWLASPAHARSFAVTIAGLLFYIAFSERLGFIASGLVVIGALFLSLGVRIRHALPLALAITLAIQAIFFLGLRVPLPWGVLEPLRAALR